MKRLLEWLDDRTGICRAARSFLFDAIPGGARWRHAWGSLVVATFLLQVVTGFFLWTAYSASAQTAWESVFHLQFQTSAGWFLRGLHHYAAQAFVVVLVLHVAQWVVFRLYQAPRELGFWLALLLVPLAVGSSVTGWMLPYDQKGFWGARVPLNILGITPVLGPSLQKLLLGGAEPGHQTLTRFLALHAGLLPLLIATVLALHLRLHWRAIRSRAPEPSAPVQAWWPDQFLKNAVLAAGLVVFVAFFALRHRGAELLAPADPAESFSAARPEWFFLFLFQFLKLFPSGTEIVGAMIIPTFVFGLFIAMPWIARRRGGHAFNVALVATVFAGAVTLTAFALRQDRSDPAYRSAVDRARRDATRAIQLAGSPGGIPRDGALSLLRNDPLTQGPRLFARHCASCHRFDGHDGAGKPVADPPTASDLKGFASREWLAGLLDPARIDTLHYFGGTKAREGKMARFVKRDVAAFDAGQREQLRKVILAVSAEAGLKAQRAVEQRDTALIEEGRKLADTETLRCTECHAFRKPNEESSGPELTGYGSRGWLVDFIADPSHPRFYGTRNDRMPAFGANGAISPRELGLIADWLRGEWYAP